MNKVIKLLEEELERQEILSSVKRAEELKKLYPDYNPKNAIDYQEQLVKAIKILKSNGC